MYFYNSPVGLMEIRYDTSNNRYLLIIKGMCYGAYPSPLAAADDVYMHVTGFYEWDSLSRDVSKPRNIKEWEKE
ncbi:MAG: hypothetical protein GX434_04195 [Peptococcaceae bacterium]|nr:hypothetical protein [Peptococcaceae bacterium]